MSSARVRAPPSSVAPYVCMHRDRILPHAMAASVQRGFNVATTRRLLGPGCDFFSLECHSPGVQCCDCGRTS
eukprot:scaffold20869_cov120-Isochrysis_galbana.AAC.2